ARQAGHGLSAVSLLPLSGEGSGLLRRLGRGRNLGEGHGLPALRLDLRDGAGAERVRMDGEVLRELAVAEDLDQVVAPLDEALRLEGLDVDRRAGVEHLEGADVDVRHAGGERVAEPAL